MLSGRELVGNWLAKLPVAGAGVGQFSKFTMPLIKHAYPPIPSDPRAIDKKLVTCPSVGFSELVRVSLFLLLGPDFPDVHLDEITLKFDLQNAETAVEQYTSLEFRGYTECRVTHCPGLQTYLDGTIWTFEPHVNEALIYRKAREYAVPLAQRVCSRFMRPF